MLRMREMQHHLSSPTALAEAPVPLPSPLAQCTLLLLHCGQHAPLYLQPILGLFPPSPGPEPPLLIHTLSAPLG